MLRFYSLNLSRYPGVVVLVIAPVLAWMVEITGISRVVDNRIRDQIVARLPLQPGQAMPVLVVETQADAPRMTSDDALNALTSLRRLGAKGIVLPRLPDDSSTALIGELSASDIVIGRYSATGGKTPQYSASPGTDSAPALLPSRQVDSGEVRGPKTEAGISRRYEWRDAAGDIDTVLLADRVVDKFSIMSPGAPASLLVNFRGLPDLMPRISISRLLNGGVVAELVAGKVVFLGDGLRQAELGVQIPAPAGAASISPVMWHAIGVNAVASGGWIKRLGGIGLIAGILMVTGLALVTLPRAHANLSIASILLPLGALFIITTAALWMFSLWLPLSAFCVCVFGVRWLANITVVQRIEFRLRNLFAELSIRTHAHPLPTDPLEGDDLWQSYTSLARQLFPVKRMVCMQPNPQSGRLDIVYSVDCAEADLVERRRDVNRSPWADVNKENWPATISELNPTRPILLERVDEDQYVIPLRYAGENLGYWVMCVESHAANTIARFREVSNTLAIDISEQLYRRREIDAMGTLRFASVRGWLRFEKALRLSADVVSGVKKLDQRLRHLEDLFDHIEDATICFDLFGRVVFVNKASSNLLAKAKAIVFDHTASEFLVDLTRKSAEEVSDILRQVVLEKQSLIFPLVKNWGNLKGTFIVRIKTFEQLGDSSVGELTGLVFQIVETDEFNEPYRLQTQLAQHLDYGLRNQLTSISLASEMLKEDDVTLESAKSIAAQIEVSVNEAEGALENARAYLHADIEDLEAANMPMDPTDSLLDIISDIEGLAKKRDITLNIDCPKLGFLTVGDINVYRRGLRGILDLLIDEAYDGSSISVALSQGEEHLSINFENDGSGYPSERLQEFVFGDEDVDSQHLRLIRKMAGCIRQWGGDLSVSSQVGSGIAFQLSLQRVF